MISHRSPVAVMAVIVVAVLGATSAAGQAVPAIQGPAQPASTAERFTGPGDIMTVSQLSTLEPRVILAAVRAAARAGGNALPGRGAMVGMTRLTRGATVVQEPPSGMVVPMGFTVLPLDIARYVMGGPVAEVLARNEIVLGQISATLRGAQVGDTMHLQPAGGGTVTVRIGRIAPDTEIGGAEIVAPPPLADLLGVTDTTRIMVWGFRSRAEIDAAVLAEGLFAPSVRIGRSWDAPNPDSALSLSRTKAALGEFAYRPIDGDQLALTPGWRDENIGERVLFAGVGVRAACHRVVRPAIQGALNELAGAGLGGLIDLANTNRYGGCYNPRFNRVTGNLGFVSRHAWGQALDVNTSTNALGTTPRLDCRVVRIFRKWGFAWGGNFTSRDGMHFEWVGEPRHELDYPSTYCPNFPRPAASPARVASPRQAAPPARAELFGADGLVDE